MIGYLKKEGEGNERTAYSEENERDEQHESVRRGVTQLHPLK
jgi:hypothetical protein